MSVDITVEGVDEVLASLQRLPQYVQQDCFKKALTAASVPVLAALEPRIPIATGLLKSSLEAQITLDSAGRGGQLLIGFPGMQGEIARFVEFGHRDVSHSGKEIGFVHAKPFMRPALATAAGAIVEAFYQSLMATLAEHEEQTMVSPDVTSSIEN